jgi:hypothetical protein
MVIFDPFLRKLAGGGVALRLAGGVHVVMERQRALISTKFTIDKQYELCYNQNR